jgi:hypothetical protein
LQSVFFVEAFLYGMQMALLLQTFDGRDLALIGLDREHRTRFRGSAIDDDGAGPTSGRVTTDMGSRQMKSIAQPMHQEGS